MHYLLLVLTSLFVFSCKTADNNAQLSDTAEREAFKNYLREDKEWLRFKIEVLNRGISFEDPEIGDAQGVQLCMKALSQPDPVKGGKNFYLLDRLKSIGIDYKLNKGIKPTSNSTTELRFAVSSYLHVKDKIRLDLDCHQSSFSENADVFESARRMLSVLESIDHVKNAYAMGFRDAPSLSKEQFDNILLPAIPAIARNLGKLKDFGLIMIVHMSYENGGWMSRSVSGAPKLIFLEIPKNVPDATLIEFLEKLKFMGEKDITRIIETKSFDGRVLETNE